jgi:hypothetical protein
MSSEKWMERHSARTICYSTRLAKNKRTSTWERSVSSLHKHIKMGSLFEQPRNAGTLCKMRAKLVEVPEANMMQSSVARKSVVQIFEIRMV